MVRLLIGIIIISGLVGAFDVVLQVSPAGFFVKSYTFGNIFDLFARSVVANIVVALLIAVPPSTVYTLVKRKKPLPASATAALLAAVSAALVLFLAVIPYESALLQKSSPLGYVISATVLLALALGFGWLCRFIIFRLISARKAWFKTATYAVASVVVLAAFSNFTFVPLFSGGKGYERLEGPNVIIISVDALRRDYVSAYDDTYVNTPNIDSVAERGYLFRNSFTNSPWTLPALMTMNSGQYPSVHGIGTMRMPADVPMLADILRRHGYRTEGYVGNEIVRPGYNFDKGFDRFLVYYDKPWLDPIRDTSVGRVIALAYKRLFRYRYSIKREDTTKWCTERVLSRLDELERNEPYFLWVHYLDPHTPLFPPERYIYGTEGEREKIYDFALTENTNNMLRFSEDYEDEYVELYKAEVRYVDDSLGDVFAAFDDYRVWEDTVVIITADHGEEHFEHGRYGHARTLYDEIIAVPLIIYFPDKEGDVVEGNASLIDIPNTILSYIGSGEAEAMAGNNLLDYIEGSAENNVIYADGTQEDLGARSVRDGGSLLVKYTRDITDTALTKESIELYRYKEDPYLCDDVFDESPEVAGVMRARLEAFDTYLEEKQAEFGTGREVRLAGDQVDRLKNLGYF